MRSGTFMVGVALLVSACGGGGGDGGAVITPISATPLQITANNYGVVAQESLSSAVSVTDSSLLLIGAQTSRDTAALAFMRAQVPKLGGWMAAAPKTVTGVTTTEPVSCGNGNGVINLTINDNNNNDSPDAGDSFTLVAQNCVFDTVTLSGTMAFTINAITGDFETDVYSVNIAVTLTNLVASDATGTVTSNATMTASLASTGVNANSFAINTSDFTMVSVRANVAYTRVLTNFSATQTTAPAGLGFTQTTVANGTLGSTGLENKSVTLATLTPFVRSSSQSYPASGVATATGASGSKIRMTALNSTSVQIELDADGNNVYETSQTKLWSELI